MILVDSSVWIDYFSHRVSPIQAKLENLLSPNNQTVITGIIFQEVLQGIRNPRTAELIKKMMRRLPLIVPGVATHFQAAELYQGLRRKGCLLSTIDALIASLAMENEVSLFTLDTDFQKIAKYTSLSLL